MSAQAMFGLAGKVAVITGGGRGIGFGIAEGLARSGARVVLSGRTQSTLDAAAARLREQGHDAAALTSDVSREEDVVLLRDSVVGLFGTVDILVNNAGVNPIYRGIEKTSLADWANILGTNLTGVFLCCKYLGSLMAERRTGGDRRCQLRRRPCRPQAIGAVLRGQRWRRTADQGARARLGRQGRARQLHRAGILRNRPDGGHARQCEPVLGPA